MSAEESDWGKTRFMAVLTLQRYLTHSSCSAWPIARTAHSPDPRKQPSPLVCVSMCVFLCAIQ